MLKSKIHRATVGHADLHYVGSVTIDADLMDAADLLEGEQVTIVDIDNGARLVTYAITGEQGSGVIGINGAAAHRAPGDLVILIAYAAMDDAEARRHRPRVVFVDQGNRRIDIGDDPAHVPDDEFARAAGLVSPGCAVAVLLAIDVRNTHRGRTVLRIWRHAKVVQNWRIRTEPEVTADELALTIEGLIGDDSEQLTGVAALSTVPSVLHEVRAMLGQYWPSVRRSHRTRCADRDTAAGRQPPGGGRRQDRQRAGRPRQFRTAAIVVDFGSSICVDAVSGKLGVPRRYDRPQIQLSSDAAAARSAALRQVELAQAAVGDR